MEVLAEDPEADVAGVRLDPDTREPQIVILDKDRSEYLALDPAVADDLTAIRALHPGDPRFPGADDADATWLIAFTNDTGPMSYYAYDRATKTGRFLFEHKPELSRYELAAMEPFQFTARDRLVIHGYLTFPPGVARRGLPAVLNVHGGPQVRDEWGLDPRAQWFANRGYLCVQVNYRGSTGYGKAFVTAGDREWGGKMHDDLVDAVGYVTGEGWADPARVAIFGGSYGGYAALVGAAFTPEVFRCAIDLCGPSNLKTLIETIPPYWAPVAARSVPPGGRPGQGRRVHVVPVTAVAGARHPDPAVHRPGRQRPPGEAGRIGADRGRAARSRDRVRVHAVPGRRSWPGQTGEPAAVLRRGRAISGPSPGRPGRTVILCITS